MVIFNHTIKFGTIMYDGTIYALYKYLTIPNRDVLSIYYNGSNRNPVMH